MRHLKTIITMAVLFLPFLFVHQQANATSNITVQMNGQTISFDQPPVLEKGRVLVPMRKIFESVGAKVVWKGETSTIIALKDNLTITIPLNNKFAILNGVQQPLDVPAKSVNGRTLVPLRFVSEALGCEVNWDRKKYLVTIVFNENEQAPNLKWDDLPPEEKLPITGDISTVPNVTGETAPTGTPLFD